MENSNRAVVFVCAGTLLLWTSLASGQLIDNTQALNTAKAGINKSLIDEIGMGRGDILTPNSSVYIINRDPFRSVRRGRQLFQRKFTRAQGQGPGVGDGTGNINSTIAIGAGLVDSCGGCHARPRGSAGFGGDVVTRPDSRSAPHLFGLGLKEMLADEITADLRAIRAQAISQAIKKGDRKSTRLNSSHLVISYAVFCLKKKKKHLRIVQVIRETHEHTTSPH